MKLLKNKAMQLILLFGLVSLFGDIVYEGARSVNGPYLKTLGASAAIVGLVAGLGEFIGYGVRLISGYYSDKTKAYWVFTFVGYATLISVPAMALTGIWQTAAFFIVAERLGKALRSPARDTIVSQAARSVGTGMGFAIGEVLDQIGAVTGPLIFCALFYFMGPGQRRLSDYRLGYALFLVPFILLMICVYAAYRRVPHPEELESAVVRPPQPDRLTKTFWLYTVFSFFATAGFINFALLGFHFKNKGILSDAQIPLFYAIAMGVDAVAALIVGKLYDTFKQKKQHELAGLSTLLVIPVVSAVIPLLVFSDRLTAVVLAVILWGVVMGAHETIMKSAIADLVSLKKRGTGYGIFNAGYGLAMFVGGALMGLLYEKSLPWLVGVCIFAEIIAIYLFYRLRKMVFETHA